MLDVSLQPGQDRAALPAEARKLAVAIAATPAVRSVARVDEFLRFQDSTIKVDLRDSIFRTDTREPVIISGVFFLPMHAVSDNYFSTLGIPLLRGRRFARTDSAGAPLVAVLSERVARAIWGGRGDVGRTFRLGRNGPDITVVGVVGDVHDASETMTRTGLSLVGHPDLYFSDRQATGRGILQLLVRPTARGGAATAVVNEKIRTDAPNLNGFAIRPYVQTVSEASEILRIFGGVIGTCAIIALALSLVGIYGVVGYGVVQRTREIGIRMALGGSAPQIRGHVMRGGMRVAAIGVIVGVLLAAGLAQLVRAWLLDVSPLSPTVYLLACGVFAAAAYAAGYIPSRRATRVDPIIALRAE